MTVYFLWKFVCWQKPGGLMMNMRCG